MQEDKVRWNKKHATKTLPSKALELLQENVSLAKGTDALDIACGQGRNSIYLAKKSFRVDSIDISDFALEKLSGYDGISTVLVDLDSYDITPNRYDIIVNSYFLKRRLFPQIVGGLKKNGLVVFETFLNSGDKSFAQPSNPDFLLAKNELLDAFISLRILHYREYETHNMKGEKVVVAQLVARKES